jgi:RimJ/RimL family protein N-acetyltransferase
VSETSLLPPFPEQGLRGDSIVVRVWDPAADGPGRLRLFRDPDSDRWGAPVFVPRPVDLAAVQGRLERELESAHAGRPSSYAVAALDDGRLLGDIGLRLPDGPMAIGDVGYSTLPEARGRGVARTALRLLSDWLLDPAGPALARVQLDHVVENVASCRVAAGAGFEQEGIRRGYLPVLGDDVDHWFRHDVCLHGRAAGLSTG